MRTIDVDEAIINFGFEWDDIPPTREEFVRFLKKQPTVDAVPVVRCAKCRNWVKNDDGQYVCALFDIANSYGEPVVTKPDNFCSYGKRKGEVD